MQLRLGWLRAVAQGYSYSCKNGAVEYFPRDFTKFGTKMGKKITRMLQCDQIWRNFATLEKTKMSLANLVFGKHC